MDNQQEMKQYLINSDEILATVINEVGNLDLRRRLELSTQNHFGTLVFGIVGQRNPERVTIQILQNMRVKYSNESPTAQQILDTPKNELEILVNSYKKANYLVNLAESVITGKLDLEKIEEKSDDEIVAQLTAVKGIGKWTAEQFLFWHLERPDILGSGDPAIKKAVMRLYHLEELPSEEDLNKIAEPWKPYRTMACHYLLRSRFGPGVSQAWPSGMPRPISY